ncbi:PepSY domain-containing protein [Gammaproteobacteria bacterium]|nr:PepSY domain-containing protein [Gammaproteobacteria bacterium]MEC8315107.1 PepSY-associated TM helix domain-containing protein [Pseudomonadota bacterium]MEC8448385.1 PepSY-associated TM helix domain-containing protein [Pseudomonadota bacterium]MEC8798338.1 PepSY-associated TM helix domain-containing protein [Pseudomonadota bacterium]MED5348733.1 PepSY-associated TM helix domain-containing protein [Pseudomonadota bacterium]
MPQSYPKLFDGDNLVRSSRKIHKYLSLAISIQLLLWTVSGIYFSFNKIEDVRGNLYLKPEEQVETPKVNKISHERALQIVADKTYLKPLSLIEITEDKPGSEYRGRDLPLYKIESSNKNSKNINIYIDPYSAKIVAIRSNQWRIWDFMWGLHIMDWNERDDIGNVFLKIFSILALLSAISGIYLFFYTNKKS